MIDEHLWALEWLDANFKRLEFDVSCTDEPTQHKLNDDPGYLAEREELRQAGIDAKNMQILPVFYNYGVARNYQHLNSCERKR